MKKLDNRGFTLVELLICIIIFGVVLVAVFGFMMASAKSFNTVNDRLDLQLQAQLTSNQLSEYLVDCTGGICTSADGKAVYILNREPSGGADYTVHIFKQVENRINYGRQAATYNAATQKYTFTDLADSELSAFLQADGVQLLLKDAQGNTVTQPGSPVASVELSLRFEKRSAKYSVTKNIALRNLPPLITVEPV